MVRVSRLTERLAADSQSTPAITARPILNFSEVSAEMDVDGKNVKENLALYSSLVVTD